jgi:uncharacterized membrane protein
LARDSSTTTRRCQLCGGRGQLVAGAVVRNGVAEQIRADHPDWDANGFICRTDLNRYRSGYVQSMLERERGELSSLEAEVLDSITRHELLAEDVDALFEERLTFGQRLADRVADFGGSWTFIICFGVFLFLWMLVNSIALLRRPFDPFPYILLNLVLSTLAAIQAPLIMMSQNRQEEKDRVRAKQDFQVNLKAELEIRHLHEKLDHLLSQQWERLVEIQQIQLELLADLAAKRRSSQGDVPPSA